MFAAIEIPDKKNNRDHFWGGEIMFTKNLLVVAILSALPMAFMPAAQAQQNPATPDTTDARSENGEEELKEETLEAIKIEGQYVDTGAKSAMKLDVPVLDTPFSVKSYNDSFMKAIETTNIADLYNYMTGIRRGGVSGYDLSIRGFKTTQADKGAILVDGLPGLAGRFGSPPTVSAESIEVVKGPMSVLYGQAQPGGFVNIITKKPKYERATSIDLRGSAFSGDKLSLGDATGYTYSIDTTGHVDEAGKFLYRLIAEKSDKDGFRDYTYDENSYIAPSLTWNVSDTTALTALMEFRDRKNSYDNLLVAPDKDASRIADITTRYQEPGDLQKENGHSATLSLTHWFPNDVTFNFSARSVAGEDHAKGYDNVSVLSNGTTVQRRARQQHNERTYKFFDSNLSIPFKTGGIEHKLLAGVSGGVDSTDFERIQFYNGPTSGALSVPGPGSINVDVYHPIYGVAPPLSSFPSGPLNRRYTESTSQGVYLSDLLTLSEHWKATLGLRYTKEKQVTEERKTPPLTRLEKTISDVLPTVGLMFQPSDQWTIYSSYATSFVPQGAAVQDAAGVNAFDPQSANQIEVGTKVHMLDGRLSTTFALFDIHKENTLAPIACNAGVGGTCSQQVGGERSKGMEVEVDFQPIDGWQILAGYAYTDASIDKTYAANAAPLVGARLTNSARSSANLWTRYDFSEGALSGAGVGLGVVYSSEITGSLPSLSDRRVLVLPSYVIADLAFYYTLRERYHFTLKVGNLFDKRYFEGVNSTTNENGVVPGAPRNIAFSLRVPF
jgi:iron complex outermembrane receptor protein